MPSIRTLAGLILFFFTATAQAQDVALGGWKDHLPYRKTVAVAEGGGHVYCASFSGLFRYTPATGEFARITKVNALNDVGIQGLAWNEPLGMLLVYYTNGNLDLVQGESSFNMSDIKRSSLLGDKGIYCAYFEGTTAYLGCGFGIVKLDMERREVRETWFIGPSGSQVKVNGITIFNDSIYAATQVGLFAAWRQAPNLAAFDSWRKRTDVGPNMANGPFNTAVTFGERLVVNYRSAEFERDTLLLIGADNTITRFAPLYGRLNKVMDVSNDGQYLIVPHAYDIHRYDQGMNELVRQYGYEGGSVYPSQAIHGTDGSFWISDQERGLVHGFGYDIGVSIVPNAPRNASAYRIACGGGSVYVSTGGVEGTWANKYLKEGMHVYNGDLWHSFDNTNAPLMQGVNAFGDGMNDLLAVVVDPADAGHAYIGGWDEGIVEFRGHAPYAILNATNSGLREEINGSSGRVLVPGLCYDTDGNLWVTNASSDHPIAVLKKDGSWKNFSPGAILNGIYLVGDIVAARNGYKWVIRPRGNALMVFNDGGTIDDTGDDQYKLLNNFPGTGGLPSQDVYCLAEDLDGQVWVGTNKGVAVFYTPEAIFSSDDYDAQQILIEQDGNVQILLETEAVSCLAVDGANRKWIGTQTSGAFLVSPDGQTQIHHFTQENSPLPSNNITSIAIDELSGEVYFGTDRGILTFRSDALASADDSDCASVFPNPVEPGYTGPVAITGLVRDSEVKITDISGNLVYRTTSLGGQAIWNGNDMSGNRVSTGVYLIFASDRSGSYKCNTKVLVTR